MKDSIFLTLFITDYNKKMMMITITIIMMIIIIIIIQAPQHSA